MPLNLALKQPFDHGDTFGTGWCLFGYHKVSISGLELKQVIKIILQGLKESVGAHPPSKLFGFLAFKPFPADK